MRLEVLGCHGGELPGCRSTCFLIDGTLCLDAGSLTSTLSLEQLCKVDHVILTHSHFDHIKDLPLMADLIVGRRDTPVTIHASTECAKTLRENMFNDTLWPDFTAIPDKKNPVFRFKPFKPGGRFEVGRYAVKTVPVTHTVESCAFILDDGAAQLCISGDTGPTERLWKELNALERLKVLLLETSFPNTMQGLADISGHLTPKGMEAELKKFDRKQAEVMLYHLKPAFVAQLKAEVAHLPVRVLELGDQFEL